MPHVSISNLSRNIKKRKKKKRTTISVNESNCYITTNIRIQFKYCMCTVVQQEID